MKTKNYTRYVLELHLRCQDIEIDDWDQHCIIDEDTETCYVVRYTRDEEEAKGWFDTAVEKLETSQESEA